MSAVLSCLELQFYVLLNCYHCGAVVFVRPAVCNTYVANCKPIKVRRSYFLCHCPSGSSPELSKWVLKKLGFIGFKKTFKTFKSPNFRFLVFKTENLKSKVRILVFFKFFFHLCN